MRQKGEEQFKKNIIKTTKDIREDIGNEDTTVKNNDSKIKITKIDISLIEEEMKEAAKNLDFERAMELRDILFELKASK